MMRAPPPHAPAALLSSPLASVPRLLLSWPRAPAAASCGAAMAPDVVRSVSVFVEAPAAAAEIASASASTAPRRRLILLRHGESATGSRSTRGAFIACRREHRLFGSAAAPRWHDAASRFTERASCGLSMARKELSYQMKNTRWRPIFALETGGSSSLEGQDFEEDAGFLGRTRLGRLIQAAARELFGKLNSVRTNSPTKIFLVLLGFYTANALATILGQTGDWDVLVAGVVVAAIEGIGMLMYKKPVAKPPGRFQSFVSMINYWKAGVCLGLFVDAFKVGS